MTGNVDRQRQNKKQAPDPHAGGATASKVDATALKLLDQGVPEQRGRLSCKCFDAFSINRRQYCHQCCANLFAKRKKNLINIMIIFS